MTFRHRCHRRIVQVSTIALFFGFAMLHAAAKPNIILIMVDDLDTRAMETLVARGRMPNFRQRILNLGTAFYFSNSFVTRSQCCPSRVTSLTGQYAHNHGVLTNSLPLGTIARFNDRSSVATWLKAAGYRTGLIGKYLVGYGAAWTMNYVPPGWDDWEVLQDFSATRPYFYALSVNGTIVTYADFPWDYQTDVIGNRARDFILRANSPFFLYLATSNPHLAVYPKYNECSSTGSPWEFVQDTLYTWGHTAFPAPRHIGWIFGDLANFPLPRPASFNEADISDKPAWYRNLPEMSAADVDCLQKNYWRRLESMLSVDEMIGKIGLALDQKRYSSNTILIFTSDNGFMLGEHRTLHKNQAFEESLRVPLYIAHPVPGGGIRTITKLVVNNDLAPTIALMAGATPGIEVDGRPLTWLMQNPDMQGWRKVFLFEHWRETTEGFDWLPDYVGIRTGGTSPVKLVEYPTVSTGVNKELYNLSADPYETNNLQGNIAWQAVIADLSARIQQLKTCRGSSCMTAENGQ